MISNEAIDLFRIIPARAGFTPRSSHASSAPSDHPRSRGVYTFSLWMDWGTLGSSPLARGLLLPECRWYEQLGIIPARAGFTTRTPTSSSRRPDHPRSRGVYVWELLKQTGREGSSPLARGLRRSPRVPSPLSGIIPARAGFTAGPPVAGAGRWDHPRSRGVYPTSRHLLPLDSGSSPLARGLRLGRERGRDGRGIIPARAGFTLGDRRDSNGGPPYQGAFAFTGDLGTARLSCGSVVAGQRSTTTPSPV